MDHASWARRSVGRRAAITGFALCFLGMPVVAQYTVGKGVLNAVAFEPIPAGDMVVQVLDNSEENLAIRDKIVAELTNRNVMVVDTAPGASVMLISSKEDPGAYSSPTYEESTRLRDQSGRLSVRGDVDLPKIQAPLPKAEVTTRSTYQLRLVIEAPDRGNTLWEGWATAALSDGLPETLADRMIPHLLDHIGQTVRAESFDLY